MDVFLAAQYAINLWGIAFRLRPERAGAIAGAPGNGEEQDGCSGEDAQRGHGDRGSKRL